MNKHTEGDAFLPGWRDVQKFSAWPPYQVTTGAAGRWKLWRSHPVLAAICSYL